MLNITILYPDFTRFDPEQKKFGNFHFGIAAISAVMKKLGHKVRLLHYLHAPKKEVFISDLINTNPSLICLSYTEENLSDIIPWYLWIKEVLPEIPNIAGGIYPTLSPNDALNIDGAKMVCLGEGEIPLMKLLPKIEKKEDYSKTPSIWIKEKDGSILKNPLAELEPDLDKFPNPDLELFEHKFLRTTNASLSRIYFKASRGCPFNCSYCASPSIKELYPNKEKYVRFYSPSHAVQILENFVKLNPNVKTVQFADDILPFNIDWFREFTRKYKERIGLPYRCYVHLGLINKEVAGLLKESGCYRVNCGIESGSPRILKNVFGRHTSINKMSESLSIIKTAGLQIHGSNIIGSYDETMNEVLDTIKFNAYNSVDVPVVSILNPYNGTKINNLLENMKVLKKEVFYLNKGSRIKLKYLKQSQIQFIYSTFRFMVFLYRKINKFPDYIRKPLEKIIDAVYLSRFLPFAFLNYIHDNFFDQFILTNIYKKLEKDLKES